MEPNTLGRPKGLKIINTNHDCATLHTDKKQFKKKSDSAHSRPSDVWIDILAKPSSYLASHTHVLAVHTADHQECQLRVPSFESRLNCFVPTFFPFQLLTTISPFMYAQEREQFCRWLFSFVPGEQQTF